MSIKKKVIFYINALIRRGYWYNNVAFRDCRKFWKYNTFNTDVMNIGSSSSVCAFNYDGLPIKGVNFGISANPQCADMAVLKNYFSFLNPNKSTVIIALCPFTALSGSYEYLQDRYYTILTPPVMPVFYFWKKQEVKTMMRNPLPYYPLVALFSDLWHIIRKSSKVPTEDQMIKDADIKMKNWLFEFSLQSLSSPLSLVNKDNIEDAIRLLNETILFCKEHNISPVIVIPPMYHTLSEKFSKQDRHLLFDSLFDNIEDKSVQILNYMDDSNFSNNRELFKDSFLLNEKGAKIFTKIILGKLDLI